MSPRTDPAALRAVLTSQMTALAGSEEERRGKRRSISRSAGSSATRLTRNCRIIPR